MISFWITVVPPTIDWTRLSPRADNRDEEQRTGAPAGQGGLHLVSASRSVRPARSGRRSPARDRLAAAQLPESRRGPDDDAEPATADIPAVDADVDSGELIAAQLPQVLVMHDARDGSQIGSCSKGPPRAPQKSHKPSHPGGWSRGRENGHGAGRGGWGSLPLGGWRSCWRAGARVGESECGLLVTPADFGIRTRPQA